jgi:class 3 adenylate cyclase
MPTPTITDLMDQALQAEHLGRFDAARDLLRQVISLGETPRALDARLWLGRLLIYGGSPHYPEAEDVLGAARHQASQDRSPSHEAIAVHLLALLEKHRGQFDRAIQLLEESPAPRRHAAPGPAIGQWFHYRGLVEADRGDLNYGERLLFRAHQAYQEAHHDPGLAEVCNSLANLLLRRGKADTALLFARQSLDLKRRLGDRFGEAISLGTIGRACLLQARYAAAAEAFAGDLKIAEELGDQRGIGIMLNSLGEVALLQGQPEEAAEKYLENLKTDRGPYNAIHAHLGLARAHLSAGRLDEAQAACDRMAELLEQNPQIHGLPHALAGLRAAIAGRRGEPAADEQLRQAIEALRQADQAMDTIPFLYELRDLYQRQGAMAKAVGVMAEALDLLSECGSERGMEDAEEWLRSVDSPGLTRLALARHFPGFLVEGILSGRLSRPRTRRQELAVLFSDVRGYTSLTEGLPAEQVVELLNEWFAEATRAIRRHGGVVDKFIGDAVMALFGVPEPREDAATDAVRAALEMRDALAAMNLRSKALGGREIRVGIGIDCGEAVVGFVGSHLRQSYTAIGDPVNTASRLESATKLYPGCDILISQRVEDDQRRHGVAETTFLGHPELKGKDQKVAVYQVLGHRGLRSTVEGDTEHMSLKR